MSQICPKCQTENITTSKFCKKCGSSLNAVQSVHPTLSKEASDIEKRVEEEKLYEQVALDLKNGLRREGSYAKALVDANGSEEYAKALYIKYAVQALKDEIALKEVYEKELLQKKRNEEYQQQKNIEKGIELAASNGISIEIKKQIENDGFSFLSKSVVRKNGTWDDCSISLIEHEVYLIDRQNGLIVKKYNL